METVNNTILIVEDDLGLNELISGKIAEAGYQTHSAYSVSEAIDWLSGNKPLLMVVDYSLADQTARDFIETIKSENLTLPPFVIATGHGNERVAVEMMKLGARDYIIKDTNLLELLPTIIGRVVKEIEIENKLKLAETLIENERALYLDLVNTQPAGIYRIRVFAKDKWKKNAWENANNPPYKMELASERFAEILEININTFEANPGVLIDLIHPDDKADFIIKNEEANTKIIPFRLDCRLLINDKIKWVHFESLPRKLDNGDILFTGIIYDVSEQKLAEEKLIESELRFKVLFADAPDAMFLADPVSRKIIDANNAASVLFKKQKSELVGLFQYELHPPQNRDLAKDTFKSHTEELNKSIPIENNILRSDGVIVPVEILGHSIMIGDKQLVMGTFRDITERKMIENVNNFLITCGITRAKDDFFASLAKYLSQILDMEYVCIDTLDGDGLTAHTLAIYNDGVHETNASYTLKQTPCGEVVGKTICCFPENVCNLFPHDDALRDLNAESYVGTTLWSFEGKAIGLIAIIGRKPLKNNTLAETILRLVSVRAAGELERKQVEDALRESESMLLKSQQIAQLGSYSWDITKGYWTSSAILDNIFGIDQNYSRTTQGWLNLIHPDWQDTMNEYITNDIILKHQRFNKEYKIIRKENGQECWVHGIGDIEFDSTNQAIKLFGTISNINQRKLAELTILENEAKMKKVLVESSFLIEKTEEDTNYQKIADTILSISGAKYVSFNIQNDDGLNFKTVALGGIPENILKAMSLLPYEILNKEWQYDSIRAERIKANQITHFESLSDLAQNHLSTSVIKVIEKTFNLGHVYVVKITKNNKSIGDFTILFTKGISIQNNSLVLLFVNQVGLFIERKKAEEELEVKMEEMTRFHRVSVGREIAMIELKKEINALLEKIGEKSKYNIVG